jgi:hypothetical protein
MILTIGLSYENLSKIKKKQKRCVIENRKRESFWDAGSLYNWGHIVDRKPF